MTDQLILKHDSSDVTSCLSMDIDDSFKDYYCEEVWQADYGVSGLERCVTQNISLINDSDYNLQGGNYLLCLVVLRFVSLNNKLPLNV